MLQQTSSEKLVVIGMVSGILDADYPDMMGEPDDRGPEDMADGDILSVWIDIANNGRASGSITEMAYLAIGERPLPIVSVMCGSRNDGVAHECVLPLAMDQGEQVRVRVDFDEEARRLLNCPERIDHLVIKLTDSGGNETNVGVRHDEPAWDCTE